MADNKKIKVASVSRIIHRDRAIRRAGLDSDAMIILIDDVNNFSIHKNKIFNRNNMLFINYKVFSEILG